MDEFDAEAFTIQQTRLLADIRSHAAALSRKDRAIFLESIVNELYRLVKMDQPEGGGLDGRDGPERTSLGLVLAAAIEHSGKGIRGGFNPEPLPWETEPDMT